MARLRRGEIGLDEFWTITRELMPDEFWTRLAEAGKNDDA